MKVHLDDEELAEFLLGTASDQTVAHLRSCVPCRTKAEGLHTAICRYRQSFEQEAERDRSFWAEQRRIIHNQIDARGPVSLLQWACALAGVLVLCALLLLIRTPQPPRAAANDATDDVLLRQVQGDLDQEVPTALAPADLISRERELSPGHAECQRF